MWSRIVEHSKSLGSVLKDAALGWISHGAPRSAAALAFYGVLSLAPTVMVGIAISDVFLPHGEARETLVQEVELRVGPRVAEALTWLLERDLGTNSGVIGVLVLFFGATAGFASLQASLNDAWDVESEPERPLLFFLWKRLLSFVMVAVVAAFMLALTLAGALLSIVVTELEKRGLPLSPWLDPGNFVIGLIVTTVVIAIVYRILPDAEIAWRHVIVGSAITAVLLSVGRIAVSFHLSRAAIGRGEHVGEALMVLLLGVYFWSMIFLFGAELTRVYAERSTGRPISPSSGSRRKKRKSGGGG